MVSLVTQNLDRIVFILRNNGVRCAWIFSPATGRTSRPFDAASDVDLLVEFGEGRLRAKGWMHPPLPPQ